MSFDMNSGYAGYAMSNRAKCAYEDGEMPKSKWTKKAMLAAIEEYCFDNDLLFDNAVIKMAKDEIFNEFFAWSSWHHTSKLCNSTDFYSLDGDAVEEQCRPLTTNEIELRDAAIQKAQKNEISKRNAAAREIEEKKNDFERLVSEFVESYGCRPSSFKAFMLLFPDDVEVFESKKGNECVRVIAENEPYNNASCLLKDIVNRDFTCNADEIIRFMARVENR